MNKEFFQKNWHYWVLALIILATTIYRGWNFEDWMLFRADQARDAHYAKEAVEEGLGNLRLLGPRAGAAVYLEGDENLKGDVLRLGPIYYYFQYLSALVFGGASAWALALPDFLFSLASIGLFYLVVRQFFSIRVSLATTAVFAFSFVLLEYSRFAWNTNQLVFWECLLVLALIKIIILENKKKAGIWLIILGLSIAILSQLHFLALFGFGAIVLVSLVVYRPRGINWKFWLVSATVVAVIYLPVLAADFKNDGDNIRRLAGVIGAEDEESGNKEDGEQSGGVESFLKVFDQHGKYYFLMLSSINRHEVKNISKFGIVFILVSLGLALFHFFRKRIDENGFEKNLLLTIHPLIFITFLWFVVFFAIYFKILPRIGKVRYWLMIAPLVFIFLAYWLAAFELIKNKIIKNGLIIGCTLTLVFLNVTASMNFYQAHALGKEKENHWRKNTITDPFSTLFTYGSMKNSVDYMVAKASNNTQAVCFFITEYQNRLAYDYIFDFHYPDIRNEDTSSGSLDFNCDFFVIAKTKHGKKGIDDYEAKFNVKDSQSFGALTAWYLTPKDSLTDLKNIEPTVHKRESQKAIYWKDIFNPSIESQW